MTLPSRTVPIAPPPIDVTPAQDTTYTITVIGPGGSVQAQAKIQTLYSHLLSIWNNVRDAFNDKDIEKALGYFSDDLKPRYSKIFNDLIDVLPQISAEMVNIQPYEFIGDGARFTTKRKETWNGVEREITYDIYFIKCDDGVWRLLKF